MLYAAVKREVNNDNGNGKEVEQWHVQISSARIDAIERLLDMVDYTGIQFSFNDDDWRRSTERATMRNFFSAVAQEGDALFQWEWKRRGNFRTYRIIEFEPTVGFSFYAQAERLWKLDSNGEMVTKKKRKN